MKYIRKPTKIQEVDAIQVPSNLNISLGIRHVGKDSEKEITAFGGDYILIEDGKVDVMNKEDFEEIFTIFNIQNNPQQVQSMISQPVPQSLTGFQMNRSPEYIPN